MSDETVAITELLEIDPERVDAVGTPANGTEWLILKAVDDTETVTDTDGVLAEIAKADDDDRPQCPTCHGEKTIRQGNMKCPTCHGSGLKPMPGDTEKSLMELAARKTVAGSAASGAPVPVPAKCPACDGSGVDQGNECTACAGTGECGDMPSASELNTMDADGGKITEGAGGRETMDKACGCDACLANSDDPELVAKAQMSSADINDLPDSAFAYIEPGGKKDSEGKTTPRSLRHFPVHDESHARNALSRAPQSPFGDKAMPKIKTAAKKFGIEVSAKSVEDDDAEKATSNVFSAPNPALSAAASQVTDTGDGTDDTNAGAPGTPAWEAVDAQTATDAALALMTAAELIRTFAQRESTEAAVGMGNDIFDAYTATEALCGVSQALGIMSQLAFHEGLEAAKSLPDDELIEKAGRRLAGKTVAALAAARDKAKDLADHIGGVLGDDDPAKKNDATAKSVEIDQDKLSEEIENMTTDELTKVLDAREDKLVGILAEALKGKAAMDEMDAQSNAKDANNKSKKKSPKDENTDLEDEADQGDSDSANSSPSGAAKAEGEDADESTEVEAAVKAEPTPEEIEAKQARKAAKKALREAEQAEKEAADRAAMQKAIEDATAEVRKANAVLEERLATVEKMAAPSNIARTAPVEAQNVAKSKDELEMRLAQVEHVARTTPDQDIRKAKREEAKELSEQLAKL
jgi:hypothetical protein